MGSLVVHPRDSLPPEPTDTTRTIGERGAVDPVTETRTQTLHPAPTSDGDRSTPTPFFPHIPRYQILESLGHGGMGHVFLAFDTQLKRRVALKFMLREAEASAQARKRFEAEATILAQLHHPNVVEVYDSGTAAGYRFFAMTLLPGGSLSQRRAEFGESAGKAVRVMAAVARGVQHAHERGIVHRDLKASNVLFDDVRPVVTDFGCAKWDDGEMSTHGFALFGTPSHMAPEVVARGSREHDARSDVWSLGVMLYHLLAGQLPFPDDPRTEAGKLRLFTQEPTPVRQCPGAAPGVDERLEAVVRQALAKNPSDRYPTAAALVADLERWLDGTPVYASDTTPHKVYRTAAHPARRWPLVAAFPLLLVLAAVVVAAVVWWPKAPPPTTDAPPPPPPPSVKQTLAERLPKAAAWVEFVAATGMPSERAADLPGVVGSTRLGYGEVLELESARVFMLELGNEELPFPYRLSANVRLMVEGLDTKIGTYTSRQGHRQPDQSVTHLAFVHSFGPMTSANQKKVARFINKDGWAATPARVALTGSTFLPVPENWRPVAQDPPTPDDVPGPFHTVEIDVYPKEWLARRDAAAFPKTARPLAEAMAADTLRTLGEVRTPPTLGHGFGLFVFQGGGQFRNVRITRLAD